VQPTNPTPTQPPQLCDGASPEERKRWHLKPASEFHYLNQSTCFEIPGDSNAEEYEVGSCCRCCCGFGSVGSVC